MRLAHISDQHFDLSSRWDEHLRVMRWIAADLEERKPDVITLGGDLFERRPVPAETDAAAEWLVSLASIAPVVGVYGNHDVPLSLDVMNRLEAANPIKFFDRPGVWTHYAEDGEVSIACLPWPRRAALLAALGRPVGSEELNQVGWEALRAVLRGMDAELAECGGVPIFLGHVQVRGARVSTGQPLAPGADFELGLEDLGLVRARAYLLGHIHRSNAQPLEWESGGSPVIYPGSPRRTAFGEVEDKGYVVVDIDPTVCGCSHGFKRGGCGACDNLGAVEWEFVPTPTAQMFLGEDEWGGLGTGEYGWLVGWHGLDPDQARGAEIRLRYRVAIDQRDAARAAVQKVRDDLVARGAVSVKIEDSVIPNVRARAPEIAAARTLKEKVVAYWAARGIELAADRTERVLGRLAELEAA